MLPPTSFKDQLKTNYVPSQDETAAIKKLIKAVEPQIDSLDAEIEALKQRRAIYASFVTDHRALISPIRYIPPDILRNVFSHCVPYDAPERIMQSTEAPLLLTQICCHWRDLALTTPTLWSTIFLKIPAPPQGRSYPGILPRSIMDVDVDIEAAETSEALLASLAGVWRRKVENLVTLATIWLSRAEGCLLTILFRDIDKIRAPGLPVHDGDFTKEPTSLLLSLICDRSSQWAQLDLRVTESSSSEETFFALPSSNAPHLRSIRVQWVSRQSIFNFANPPAPQNSDTTAKPSLAIFKAPRLQHLYLDGYTGNFIDIPVAWSSLTELSFIGAHTLFSGPVTGSPASDALALLQQCLNLVRCELHISEYYTPTPDVDTDPDAMSKHVLLPHLQRFVVSGPYLKFLGFLELPLLTSMSLSVSLTHITPHQSAPPLSLRPLLVASGHSIQHLEFGAISVTVAEIVDSLKFAVGLTELTINMSDIVPPSGLMSLLPALTPAGDMHVTPPPPFYKDELLVRLTPSSNALAADPIICPNLAILKLTLADPSDITTRALKNLVAHRGPIDCRSTNGQSLEGSSHAAPLTQISVRFSMALVYVGELSRGGGSIGSPGFPARWREDQVNSGFSRPVIRVERRKAITHAASHNFIEAGRRPFEAYWDFESPRYERC
ncbi:hypothetical protein BKA70DRAFT_51137 [Coprinopsis sp. MPI-PUGE-AT-0042]|nr:hypothetical protein BKA70DRAFT_51137 [Coprinopsis sp. MPI-PUGE-AT-0042]